MGSCSMPSTWVGSGMLAASSTVGATSMQCVNWLQSSPPLAIRSGQATTIGLRVPPRWRVRLPHLNGVFIAWAQAAA